MLVLDVLGCVRVGARRSASSRDSLICHCGSDHPLLWCSSHPLHTTSHLLLTTPHLHSTAPHKLTSSSHHLWLLLPSHHTTASNRPATSLASLLVHHGLTPPSSHRCSHPHLTTTTSTPHHYLPAPVIHHLHPRTTSHGTTSSSWTRLAHHLRASRHHLFLRGAKLSTDHAGIKSRRTASANGLGRAHHWPRWCAWWLSHWCWGRCWSGGRFWLWWLNWHR